MQILLFLLIIVSALTLVLLALAQTWANTPHGRLKPIFALVFGLTRRLGGAQAKGVLDAASMTDAAATKRVRAEFLKSTTPLSKGVAFAGKIEDRTLDGPTGSFPVRIYTPPGEGPFPALVYYHGGGFVVGSPDYTDAVTRAIAAQAPAVVVSVDYRMAPEHPHPAAVDDARHAVRWVSENAEALGIRPGPVAVGGDSAGGNLAAVVAQQDLREGSGQVGLQVLIYPTVDGSRTDRPSHQAFGEGYGLSLKDVEGCFAAYVPEGTDPTDPSVSPLFEKRLENLPRALVFTAGFDVLRDEGIEYKERLEEAGVPVRHIHQPEMPHGYITMTRLCREARDDISIIAGEVAAL